MSLMSSLLTGVTGLQTSQNALNTTAHNLSNIDTKGYTRQQILQSTRPYQTINKNTKAVSYEQIGMGVYYDKCRQVRDYFLDKTYRKENGRMEYYNVLSNCAESIEDIFGELNGTTFSDSLNNLLTSVEELSKDPTSAVTQSVLVQRANEFLVHSKNIYDSLQSYQKNLDNTVYDMVNRINDIGKQIVSLNHQISKIEVGGIENANDLRDSRNLLLDELSSYGNVDYKEDLNGNLIVNFENTSFVNENNFNKIGIDAKLKGDFATPYWEFESISHLEDGKKVIDNIDNALIFTNNSSDVGSLKSILLARGDYYANYEDMENYDEISNSFIMNIECEFDTLVNKLVTQVNDILRTSPSNLGNINGTNPDDYVLFISNNGMFDILNTNVNERLLKEPTLLNFKTKEDEEDIETIEKLKDVFMEYRYTLNPNSLTKQDLKGYYNSLIEEISNLGDTYKNLKDTQEQTLNAVTEARKQILDVSSDEELSNMLRLQNAYNASSRYINVVNEMLEHLIEKLA